MKDGVQGSASLIYEEPACLIQTLQPDAALRLGKTLEEGFFHGLDKLFDQGRLFLLEIACAPDSVLTTEAQAKGLSAERASLFNGHDLTTPEGLRRTLELIKQKRPRNIWISTECGPFSPIQNFNQRTEAQQQDLQQKQHEARKQHIGGLVVAYFGRSIGSEVHWEWSRRCRAWKWEPMEKYRNHLQTETSIVGGCRVGLTNDQGTGFLGKEWRVETTDHEFARNLQIKCEGPECSCHHVKCEGKLTRRSAFYTQTMAKRIVHYMKLSSCKVIKRLMSDEQTKEEHVVKMGQYEPTMCNCRLFRWKGQVQLCSSCILSERAFVGEGSVGDRWGEEDMLDEEQAEPPVDAEEGWNPQERKEWMRKIKLVHCATGHGSTENLVQVLKQKGLEQKVIDLAKGFRCEVPRERSIAWLKELLSRLAQESSSISTHEAVHQALNIWNRREMVRGFSPHQHALGQAPDLDGRFFREDIRGLPVDIMETPVGELEKKHQSLRLQAEEVFLKWQAKERLARAMNSKSKPIPIYTPGELVFYWRHLGRKEAGQRYQTGHFHGYAGPARILALETRFDEDGNVRPSSVVWLVRNLKPQSNSFAKLPTGKPL